MFPLNLTDFFASTTEASAGFFPSFVVIAAIGAGITIAGLGISFLLGMTIRGAKKLLGGGRKGGGRRRR